MNTASVPEYTKKIEKFKLQATVVNGLFISRTPLSTGTYEYVVSYARASVLLVIPFLAPFIFRVFI